MHAERLPQILHSLVLLRLPTLPTIGLISLLGISIVFVRIALIGGRALTTDATILLREAPF